MALTTNFELFIPGDDVDYEALEGKQVELRHEGGTKVYGTLIRDITEEASNAFGWDIYSTNLWKFLGNAWRSKDGWKMYIKDGVPRKKTLTAGDLEPGTVFEDCEGGQVFANS